MGSRRRGESGTGRVQGGGTYGGCFFFLLSLVGIVGLIGGELKGVEGFGAQYGLESSLFQADTDPFGETDSFESLPEKEKQRWARKSMATVDDKQMGLDQLPVNFHVEIKLVGFNGEGRHPVKVREADLDKYLRSLRLHEYITVIQGSVHSLHVKTNLIFQVVKGAKELTTEIEDAVRAAVTRVGGSGAHSVAQIHYSTVENIIQRDVDLNRPVFSIYLLNLPQQGYSYAYYYTKEAATATTCMGAHWMGKGRYLWIDLSAGPPLYGPRLAGDGFVGEGTIPRVVEYPVSHHSTALLADLAALVGKAAMHLFNPSIYRDNVHFRKNMEIRLFQIVVGHSNPDEEKLDWSAVQEETFTNNMLHSSQGLLMEDYLDSKELHHWLSDYSSDIQQEIRNLQDEQDMRHGEDLHGDNSAVIVPIFLFDIETDQALLLDQEHQFNWNGAEEAFQKNKRQLVPIGCNADEQVVQISQKGVTRAVIAATVQTLWGVAPLHQRWDPIHNTTKVDYLWSVGNTPFGKLSKLHTLSFVQRVAAHRNLIVTVLNQHIGEARRLLTAIEKYGGEHVLLHQEKHVQFTQRWNVFFHKVSRCTQLLSNFEFNHAFYFAQSAEHDIQALEGIVRQAADSLETTLDCFKDAPISYWKYLRILALLIVLVFVERKVRKKFFSKSKHKRF
ncbi:hypothetical protein CBR_g8886 [Chara braunii]|uniref:DUF7906 domain-containing protein n=1 Tax=Chara braunii TaxID=69332 RepID=A0A388KN32_CHABU|nr:hypothetical protein CBR_g8886 [Chara braunii]|eukprot:GBG71469.1 hypothetical protein CBR_g8886 [Chara braunii]